MCLIVYNPNASKSQPMPRKLLQHMRGVNPDGCGIMWRDSARCVHWKRGMWNTRDFIHRVREVEATHPMELALHCRIMTSGMRDEANCHPFRLAMTDGVAALMHNGVLADCNPPKDATYSDTAVFVEGIAAINTFDKLTRARAVLESATRGSRVIVMHTKGTMMLRPADWTVDKKRGLYLSHAVYPTKRAYKSALLDSDADAWREGWQSELASWRSKHKADHGYGASIAAGLADDDDEEDSVIGPPDLVPTDPQAPAAQAATPRKRVITAPMATSSGTFTGRGRSYAARLSDLQRENPSGRAGWGRFDTRKH